MQLGCSDQPNVVIGQLRIPVALACGNAPFIFRVLHVVRPRPREQMHRVHAGWVVASVANLFCFFKLADDGCEKVAMSRNKATVRGATPCAEAAVPSWIA